MDFIKIVNEAFATGKEHPAFRSGDTITIDYRISEGGKAVSYTHLTLPTICSV